MSFRSLILSLLFSSLGLITFGQERCGFELYNKYLQKTNPKHHNQQQFEQWMRDKISLYKTRAYQQQRTGAPPYTIPIVVHIIHNGEDPGTGTNISDAQILSQIDVLNEDYKRLNADASSTPSEFLSVAGSLDIQFVLAKQDPEGLPTNGILRVEGTKDGYAVDPGNGSDIEFKSLSYWPAEDYLNIWVINITNSYIGYAQFPETSLPGVVPPYERLTDGVVIHYEAFGSGASFNLDPQFNKGRTATHEIGHYLGLIHIWGDANCGTDYVDDTPIQQTSTKNCPAHPKTNTCGSSPNVIMFQNYMDYTDDECMNLFTKKQIDRMTIVLENSERRASLLNSKGAQEPVFQPLDLEAKKITAPAPQTCGQMIAPKLEIRNRGTTKVTSAQVQFFFNNNPMETKDFTVNMDQFDVETVSFSPIDLPEPSNNSVSFQIISVNGNTDDDQANNTITGSSVVSARSTLPFSESFNSLPTGWQVINPDNNYTWTNTTASNGTSGNKAMFVNFYDYELETVKDQLVSPYFDLTQATSAVLRFDRAYARFPGKNEDSLRIILYTDCSSEAANTFEIYEKGGTELASANDLTGPFQPSSASQWETELIPLTPYLGKNVQLVFEAVNGYGNNLYIDNVQVLAISINDVAINGVVSPAPVICSSNPTPKLRIQNLGSEMVSSVLIETMVNGQSIGSQTFGSLSLSSGAETEITLDPISLSQGANNLSFSISNPEVSVDEFESNNTIGYTWVVENSTEIIPVRQRFDDGLGGWTLLSQNNEAAWETTFTNNDVSLVYKSFTNVNRGEQAWVVSPVLDFSRALEASLFFDASYGTRSGGVEKFEVLVSEDCGLSYNTVLFGETETADDLANQTSTASWQPSEESHWHNKYLAMNDFAGKDQVRLAFRITNDNGNNFYLDNIEVFIDDNPDPPKISQNYYVYSSEFNPNEIKVTFSLDEKEPTRIQVYNMLGQVLIDNSLSETLNQTYTIDLTGQSTGIYIVRLQVGDEFSSSKLFVGR